MPQFQNGLYYKPGSTVLSYLIVSQVVPIIFVFIVLGIGLSFLQNAVIANPTIAGALPFSPTAIMGTGLPIVIVAGSIFCVLLALMAWTRYSSVQFMFDDFAFHIEHGIISKSEIAIPYRQIQNVNHEQTFSEKMWGIARVIVETAGTDDARSAESDGILPVLDAALAFALEQELLRRSSGK